MTRYFIRSIDAQIGVWVAQAKRLYSIETFPKVIYKKILFGGRDFLRNGDPAKARAFVFRQISKRWQYLNDERIVEFIEEQYGVECEVRE